MEDDDGGVLDDEEVLGEVVLDEEVSDEDEVLESGKNF